MNIVKQSYINFVQERGEYAIICNELWEFRHVDHLGKVIWAYLVSRPPRWNSSRNNLSRNLGIDRATVSKYIERLDALNMLKVTVGQRGSWSFEIVPPDQWKVEPTGSNSDWRTDSTITEGSSHPDVGDSVTHTKEVFKEGGNMASSQERNKQIPHTPLEDEGTCGLGQLGSTEGSND